MHEDGLIRSVKNIEYGRILAKTPFDCILPSSTSIREPYSGIEVDLEGAFVILTFAN